MCRSLSKRGRLADEWERHWNKFIEGFVIPYVFDWAITVLILLGLISISWILTSAGVSLLDEDELWIIKKAHFWLSMPVLVIVGVSFVFRFGRAVLEDFGA